MMFPPDEFELGRRLVIAAVAIVSCIYALRVLKMIYLAATGG